MKFRSSLQIILFFCLKDIHRHLSRCFCSINSMEVKGLNLHAATHICGYVLQMEILNPRTVTVSIYLPGKRSHSGIKRVQNLRCMTDCYTKNFFQSQSYACYIVGLQSTYFSTFLSTHTILLFLYCSSISREEKCTHRIYFFFVE